MEYIHIGKQIAMLLNQQHKSRRELGVDIGMTASAAVYLTTRASIDVRTLHKIGEVLEYNFFKHFPIEEAMMYRDSEDLDNQKNTSKEIEELNGTIAERDKTIGELKREIEMLKKENGYLNEINGLLKKK